MTETAGYKCFYALAAKGIQGYIFRTDKLKPIVGASELVEDLPRDFLDRVLEKSGIGPDEYMPIARAAGAARIIFKDPARADELARVLPCLAGQYAPGLDVVQARVELSGNLFRAMEAAEDGLRAQRNVCFAELPAAGPLVIRNPRSGLPAEEVVPVKGEKEQLSREVARKYRMVDEGVNHLVRKVSPEGDSVDLSLWPLEFDDIVEGDNSYLAVIHADANGMGQVILQMAKQLERESLEKQLEVYQAFTRGVEEASENAARKALEPVLADRKDEGGKCFPVRPIVCAGDDLTLVVAAPYAFRFIHDYLLHFEDLSRSALAGLGIPGLEGLTACAGVVFVKKSFPFAQAYGLAESLCGFSKKAVERRASAAAFWRQTASSGGDYNDILDRELTAGDTVLTMNPYLLKVGDGVEGPLLSDLGDLILAAAKLPRGSLREVVSLAYSGYEPAQRAFERLCQVALKNREQSLKSLREALIRITGNEKEPLWKGEKPRKTPLYDALELMALKSKPLA